MDLVIKRFIDKLRKAVKINFKKQFANQSSFMNQNEIHCFCPLLVCFVSFNHAIVEIQVEEIKY